MPKTFFQLAVRVSNPEHERERDRQRYQDVFRQSSGHFRYRGHPRGDKALRHFGALTFRYVYKKCFDYFEFNYTKSTTRFTTVVCYLVPEQYQNTNAVIVVQIWIQFKQSTTTS